ncbi:hypothetical protein PHLGIDRAFT_19512 [Phlebiopsis gigantea 11061_1 CR5-6]|uniref:Brain protein I3 n=1 Tax=Phlebiopsis gigantea (strain 11061_1 CR5-6) TaxID=745531 RepID=A0A0C3S6J1_PHLG1|nr:hypothetical protein PHLGIDRAFT_19512 [Phlebiopsis gigantea 11061_1 CR5-6]
MIQLDEKSDKAALADPPAYSSNETTLYPPQQSPVGTGSSYAPAQPTPAYPPSPASGAPLNPHTQQQQPPVQPQMTPAQMEAQIGSTYQQQLFAQCARGNHEPARKYGACGIIAAVLLFPIGLICLFADSEERCARCQVQIQPK